MGDVSSDDLMGGSSSSSCTSSFTARNTATVRNGTFEKYVPGGPDEGCVGGPWKVDGDYGGGPDGTGPLKDPMDALLFPDTWTAEHRATAIKNVEMPPFPPGERSEDWWSAPPSAAAFDFSSHPSYATASGADTTGGSAGARRRRRPGDLGHVSLASSTATPEPEDVRVKRLQRHQLWEAALLGDAARVRALGAAGADVRARCAAAEVLLDDTEWLGENRTALHYACLNHDDADDNVETVPPRPVLTIRPRIPAQCRREWRRAQVTALLELGADPDAATDGGDTPLHCAAARGNYAMARRLIQAGADPTVLTRAAVIPHGGIGWGDQAPRPGAKKTWETRTWEPELIGGDENDWDEECAMRDLQSTVLDMALQQFGELPAGDEAAHAPPITPYQASVLAQSFSTNDTRELLRAAEEAWREHGRVDAGALDAHMAAWRAEVAPLPPRL